MATLVRNADLQRDRVELIRFLRENLTEHSDAARFDWLYMRNPSGNARAWMAIDESSGRTVGVAGAFPRYLQLDGRMCRGYVLGDFCIAPECRSLGPALSLQRACLSGLRSEGNDVWIDFPSDRMVAIYRRLGIESTGKIIRYVKLLRVDEKVRNRLRQPALANGVSALANLVLRIQRGRHTIPADLTVGPFNRRFGNEFTELNSRAAALHPSHGVRSAEYLNWRYIENPLSTCQIFTARRGLNLVGYAVVTTSTLEWRLTDLFAADDPDVLTGILGHVQSLAQKNKIERLTAVMMEDNAFSASLVAAGFFPREGHPVIVHAENGESTPVQDAKGWFLMDGDRES